MIESDTVFMKRALDQAQRGAGLVSPNPMVGALLVKDGRVIGEGFHRYDLLKHGETYAMELAGREAQGATLYCNLEPCCHYGRTPPCTDALIEAGIARAVIATKDLNPKVNGRGVEQLRDAGIEVEVGLLEERAWKLNESYFKFVTTGRPFVHGILEYPAGTSGDWQPSDKFLQFASTYDAVMIGRRPELNRAVVDKALSRERHRQLVIAAGKSQTDLLDILLEGVEDEISALRYDTQPFAGASANVIRLEDGTAYDGARSQISDLLISLTRMDVTSLLSLPGLLNSKDKLNFSEFDKVTLVVPSNSYTQGFATRWVFGDLEFDLEDVTIEQGGGFTELTGYPVLQEVA